jgi:hypothetical protein
VRKLVFAVLAAFALNSSAQETKRGTVEVVCLELSSAVESLEKKLQRAGELVRYWQKHHLFAFFK